MPGSDPAVVPGRQRVSPSGSSARVRGIELLDGETVVYNLEVSPHASFCADGFFVEDFAGEDPSKDLAQRLLANHSATPLSARTPFCSEMLTFTFSGESPVDIGGSRVQGEVVA